MLTKEALTEIEILVGDKRVYPWNMAVWFFYSLTCLRIIEHYLTSSHLALIVNLPKYRGTTPIETPLLNGDTETGVSVMRLVKEMDAGPILAQATVKITPETTKQSLYDELSTLGAKLISDVLDGVLAKNAPETLQDDSEATFTAKLDKSMSELKFAEKGAQQLVNEVRAFAGFPKSKTILLDIPCTITAAHVADNPATEIDQKCADGKYFIIDRLLPENSKEMDAKSFLNGHKR